MTEFQGMSLAQNGPAVWVRNFKWGITGEAQEMLIEHGHVVARGPSIFPLGPQRPSAGVEVVDLAGKTVLPAFVDAHCHILPTGLDLKALHLGAARTHQDVLDLVRERHAEQPEGWLLGIHYDQGHFGGEHMHRDQLDAISSARPILLRHVTGHASVANSAALAAAHVKEDVEDPVGGTFGRDASGRLTGVCLEQAHELVSRAVAAPSLEEMVEAILLAGEKMREYGIGCASDMMTGRFHLERELQAYRIAAERGCAIETRLYLQYGVVFGRRALAPEHFADLTRHKPGDRWKVAGIKIFADGAIGSGTAAIYGNYAGKPSEEPILSRHMGVATHPTRHVSGQLIYSPDKLRQRILRSHEAGFQVAVHSIGDYSTDLVMDAFEATGEPSRHRIEHAMMLSEAQIERLAKLNCFTTFQPEFLARFAGNYTRQLGPEATSKLIRTRSVLDAGIRLSFNSDRPIVTGDPWVGIRAAVNRPEAFDASENCTLAEALTAYTVGGAEVNGDGHAYGSLEPGSIADLQVLEAL